MTRARARRADPPTSHAAAKSVGDLSVNQRAVMTVMRLLGQPVLDERLVAEYQSRRKGLNLPQQSESGLRSRRAELARQERLIEGVRQRMSTGRLGRTWSVKEEQ